MAEHEDTFKQELVAAIPHLRAFARSLCNDPTQADDLAQEALAKALRKSGQLRDPAALNTWLFSILSNCWRDHLRRHRETEDIDNVVLLHEETPEREHDDRQIVDKVRSAIARLPEGQRQVVTLVDLEGFTYMEVARILEIPIGTVMSRLCRAHSALRSRLLREFDRDPAAAQARFRRIK